MSGGPGAGLPRPIISGIVPSQLLNWTPGQPIRLVNPTQAWQSMPTWQQTLTGPQHMGTTGPIGPAAAFQQLPQAFLAPDPKQPDTLGWREWSWSGTDKMLKSPSQGTLWPEAELVVPHWDEGDVVRGSAGIHAHLVPKHWKILGLDGNYVPSGDPMRVHGIVERFGKYVLGTDGWRAEWVIIKELMAPSTKIGLEIEQAYPDVIVHYPEEEGDVTCELVKSSALGKGSRPTSRPKPSPPSIQTSNVSQPTQNQLLAQMQAQTAQAMLHLQFQKAILAQPLQNASVSQPMHPLDIGQSQPSSLDEPGFKISAVVFWFFVGLAIIAVARCAT